MAARAFMNNAALYLAMLAFLCVAGLSYINRVEPLIAVLRGAGAFFAMIFLLRTLIGLFAPWIEESQQDEQQVIGSIASGGDPAGIGRQNETNRRP